MGKNKKVPRQSGNPYSGKKPKAVAETKPRGRFNWTTNQAVLDGDFGFMNVAHSQLLHEIIPRLHAFQSMNWEELGGQGCHQIEFSQLSKEGQRAVSDYCEDELDVYSLRINGKTRIMGMVEGNVYLLRWYDPEHKFCPSALKHT